MSKQMKEPAVKLKSLPVTPQAHKAARILAALADVTIADWLSALIMDEAKAHEARTFQMRTDTNE